jgi:hypothetical protein
MALPRSLLRREKCSGDAEGKSESADETTEEDM